MVGCHMNSSKLDILTAHSVPLLLMLGKYTSSIMIQANSRGISGRYIQSSLSIIYAKSEFKILEIREHLSGVSEIGNLHFGVTRGLRPFYPSKFITRGIHTENPTLQTHFLNFAKSPADGISDA